MGLLGFFKKLIGEEAQKNEPEPKNISFDELDSILANEIKKVDKIKDTLKNSLVQEVNGFNQKINEQFPILRKIDINHRREVEKIKIIVTDSLAQYIFQLEKLIAELKEAENEKSGVYAQKIYSIFGNFDKNSKLYLNRATILIGKELEVITNLIAEFLASYNRLISENKDSIEKESIFIEIKTLIEQKSETIKLQKNSEKVSDIMREKIKDFEKDIQEKRQKFETIKTSSKYTELLADKEKIRQEKIKFGLDLVKLKDKINLKSLAKYFHNDVKKSKLIHSYLDNFILALENDNSLDILNLLAEARQEFNIANELKNLKLENDKLKENKEYKIENEILTSENEIQMVADKIKEYTEELRRENNKVEKFNEKTLKIISEIKDKAKLVSLNVL